MADHGEADGGETRDLSSILSGDGRDVLIRNNGDQVKIANLNSKVVGLYFSASWCDSCRQFTPKLVETYRELTSKGSNFEVIFISADEDDDSFRLYFSEMPWLAIPFSDFNTRDNLDKLFSVRGIPHLVIIDGSGKVLTDEGVQAVGKYGFEGYPFTAEKMAKMKDEQAAKKEQTLQSILVSPPCDFLISNNGNKVPVSDLEGKVVGLYFYMRSYGSCIGFTPIVAEMYGKLKERGDSFEVVLISLDDKQSSFEMEFVEMPWLAIPFKDKRCDKLVRYFELETMPTLVVYGPDGKIVHANAAELVGEYGIDAYPFTPEKLEELAEKDKARLEAQTLESLLVSGERDHVIGKDGIKVPVSELVGKKILVYFSAEWCPACHVFLPKLIEAYHKIKEEDSAFEVVFISHDLDRSSFDEFFSGMPWLALPFGDERRKSLVRTFKVCELPSLVALGPTGKTITDQARDLVLLHGADAYPFTEERMKQLEAEMNNLAGGLPKKVKQALLIHDEHIFCGPGAWCANVIDAARRRVMIGLGISV